MANCDDVFRTLTRGPFPTGDPTDVAIESHLAACADCRRLAEALRPCEAYVPEMVAPEECRSLPCYGGPSSSIEPRVLSVVLAKFEYSPPPEPAVRRGVPVGSSRWRWSIPWSGLSAFLGAVSVGLSLAMLYYGLQGVR